jgi:hypothetical protein
MNLDLRWADSKLIGDSENFGWNESCGTTADAAVRPARREQKEGGKAREWSAKYAINNGRKSPRANVGLKVSLSVRCTVTYHCIRKPAVIYS